MMNEWGLNRWGFREWPMFGALRQPHVNVSYLNLASFCVGLGRLVRGGLGLG
jgi:hypothetical protein